MEIGIRGQEGGVEDEPKQSQVGHGRRNYAIRKLRSKCIQKNQSERESWEVQLHLNRMDYGADSFHQAPVNTFNEILDRVADDMQDNDRIRFVFNHPALNRPINLPLMLRGDADAERIMIELERVIQSNEGFDIDDLFTMDISKVYLPEGRKFMNRNVPISKLLHDKKSIVTVKNNDNMCMARVLVTAIAKVDADPRWKVISDIRCGKDQLQKQMARELCEQAGVDPNKTAGILDAKKFQSKLINNQIVILSKAYFNAIIYAGPEHNSKYNCSN